MRANIRSFAQIREIVGAKSVEIEIEGGSTVQNAIDHFIERYPQVRPHLLDDDNVSGDYMVALNQKRIDHDQLAHIMLSEGDEIAILPPAGGG